MKLVSCRIDGFGKFRDCEVRFEDGLNVFCFENGWGKTTIAAFICAMLYGLASERANARDTGERAKWRPFEGRAYGGRLKFTDGGHTYLIKRAFDARKESKDLTEAYVDGKLSPDLADEPGKHILGIDEQSFVRTLYAGSEQLETGSTGDIEARLNAYTQGDASADEAIKKLDAERKKYLPDRGNGGLINAERATGESIRADIYAARQQAEKLDGLYAERAALDKQRRTADAELKVAGSTESRKARRQTYERYIKDASEEKLAADKIRAKYPCDLPDGQTIEDMRGLIARLRATQNTDGQKLSNERKNRLEELEKRFAVMPEKSDIEACKRRMQQLKAGTPSSAPKKGAKFALAALFIAAVIAIAVGIALFALELSAAGLGLCAAGIVMIIAGIFLSLNARISSMGGNSQDRQKIDAEVGGYLARFGYSGGIYDFEKMLSDLDELQSLRRESGSVAETRTALKRQSDGIYARITDFFRQYMPTGQGTPEEMLSAISADRSELLKHENMYGELMARAGEYADSKDFSAEGKGTEELVKKLAELNSRIAALENGIDVCEQSAGSIPLLQAKLEESEQRLNAYQKTHSAIVKTIEYIRAADGEIKDKFSSPVAKAFTKYMTATQACSGKNAALDGSLKVMFEGGGVPRGEEFMSSGQRAASAICFRLALGDCLFGGKPSFLMLDDPFVHLDENMFAQCARILREIAKTRQIIYFTCHPSRRL